MPSDRITTADLDRALQAHATALEAARITYDGRLILDHGSRTYGRAYRLNLTNCLDRCQERRYWVPGDASPDHLYRWPDDAPQSIRADLHVYHSWNHAGCPDCNGSGQSLSSAHYRPPVGDDYLGMSAREAYDNLTTRTAVLWDVARHASTADLEDATP